MANPQTGSSLQEVQNRTVKLLGVKIHTLPVDALLDFIVQTTLDQRKAIVANVNAHAMNLAYELSWFRDFLNNADFVFCDGFGVKWGARLLGLKIPYRYTPPDWFPPLSEICERFNLSLYFLGARPGVAEEAAARLRKSYQKLNIVETFHGYFDKTPGSLENEQVIQNINSRKPNILVLGFGMPLQERWLVENWDRLEANVAIPAGAVFDYLSGEVLRAPRWVTDYGFEWFARLVIEPQRLGKRYLLGNPLFLWRLLKQRLGIIHNA